MWIRRGLFLSLFVLAIGLPASAQCSLCEDEEGNEIPCPGRGQPVARPILSGVSGSTVSLTWQGSDCDEGYTILASLSRGGTPIATLPVARREGGGGVYAAGAVPPGVYWVRVLVGFTTVGPITLDDWIEVRVLQCTTAPLAPTNLRRSDTGSLATVVLFWVQAASGCDPEWFVLEAGYGSGRSDAAVLNVYGQGLNAGSPPPGSYYVRVRAANRFGVSPPSNEILVVVDSGACTIGEVRNLSAHVGPGSTVTLTWLPPLLIPPPDSSHRYLIQGGPTPGSTLIGLLHTTTTFVAAGVAPGTYYVRVTARTLACPSGGPPSPEIVVVVP